MTCVVGLVTDSSIVIGADSGAYDETSKEIRVESKVFKKDGCIVGFCGSFRQGQLVEYGIDFKELYCVPYYNIMEYLVLVFIKNMQKLFKKHGCLTKSDGAKTMELDLLIGLHDQLFKISTDFQVSKCDSFVAIGAASAYAFGALEILYLEDTSGIDAADSALDAALKHSLYVSRPYNILELDF